LAFLLLSDRFPFDGEDKMAITARIQAGKYSLSDPIWFGISEDAKSFVSQCLTMDEQERPSAEEALLHPWLQKARDEVSADFQRKGVCTTAQTLENLKHFEARSVLAQAVATFIVSQLLVKEEKTKIDEVFREIDVSCDGKLSKQEVKDAYQRVFGCEISDDEVDKIFEHVDIAGTGYLEYSEFVIASLSQNHLFSNDHLCKAFQVFDTKNRGYICTDGLKRGLSSFMSDDEAVNDKMIRKIMNEADKDGDGKLSYEDFVSTMLNSANVPATYSANARVTDSAKKGGLMNGFLRIFDKK
jgi:calcium-dependent protein kinase